MKVIELALNAGRKRQSEVTGFVHLCYENPESRDTIPVYENLCFALALLRSRTADHVLEARALLEKLLAFEVGGQFPVYLHEFPNIRFTRSYPVISYILRDFQAVLGENLRQRLQPFIQPLPEMNPPQTPTEWGRFLVQAQLQGVDMTPAQKSWDNQHLAFIGPQQQERGEPAVTLYDLFMGQWGGRFSARALLDHPVHLQASLIFPAPQVTSSSPVQSLTQRYWGDGHPTHSLMFHTQGTYVEEEKSLRVTLPEQAVEEEIEISFFCNLHLDHQFFVNGRKATTFQLGDTVSLTSKNQQIDFVFRLESGEGKFWGHLFRGNRPGQLCCRGVDRHEAYDQIIGLRSVKRSPACCIIIDVVTRQI